MGRGIVVAGALLAAGCSLDLDGLEGADAGSPATAEPEAGAAHEAGGAVQPTDSGFSDTGSSSGSSGGGDAMGPTGCANGACSGAPAGWSLVAFASTQASPCPPGFDSAAPTNLVEGPTAAGACSCGACAVTTPPSCAAGELSGYYDYNTTVYAGTCYMPDTTPVLMNDPPGACATDIYQGSYATFDVRYNAPPLSGGACSAPGTQNSGALTYAARDRVCAPNDPHATNCSGGTCQPGLTGSYAACVAAPGAMPCPPGYPVAHAVGSSGSFSCADCACTIKGTCTGTVTLYTDTACNKGGYAISTNVCVSVSSVGSYKAYQYTPDPPAGVTCQAAAPGAAQNVALVDEQTVCCAH
jgi:hypothetical protein